MLADIHEKSVEEECANRVIQVNSDLAEVAEVHATQGLHVFLFQTLGVESQLGIHFFLRFF